jgi:hypothetical protein
LCDQYLDSTASTTHYQSPGTVILQAGITNKTLIDSIVIYDKENSWKIISSLKFKDGNIELDISTQGKMRYISG